VYGKQLKKFLNFLEEEGFKIHFGIDSSLYYEDSLIVCNSRLSDEKTLYTLLHEYGHAVLRNNEKYCKIYRSQFKEKIDGRHGRSNSFKIDVLREEFDAWRIGLEMAESLDIPIDLEKYDKYSSKYLKSYCHWVCDSNQWSL